MDVTLAEIIDSVAASSPASMPEAPADAETTRLALQARAGDAGAFCALVDLHQRAARRVAMAALGRPADADEAVQDACVTAWQRIETLDDPSAFRAWLLRITWRKALDRRRSMIKWLRRIIADDVQDGSFVSRVVDPTKPVDDELVIRERDRVVAQMIRSLPSRLRDPFLLAAAGEHRYDDIARMLGMPVGTVKWRVSEARRVLREKLARVGIGMEGGPSRPRARQ
jgi:RNA polymerase sigma-70 factor (ECF subfamily)